MGVLKFTRQQYRNYKKAANDASASLKAARSIKSQDEKVKVISKTYSMAKGVFEKIRQENRNYQPKSFFGRIVKSILLSFLNLGLKVNISGMRRFLIAFPAVNTPAQPKVLPPVLPPVFPPVVKPQAPVIKGSLLMLEQEKIPAENEQKCEVKKPEVQNPDPFAHLNPFENGHLKPAFVFKNNY